MYTTTVKLRRAWFTNPATPSVTDIVCGTLRPQARTDSQQGSVRQFSGGKLQGWSTPVGLTTIPLTLVGLSFAQWQTVLNWIDNGTVILYRGAAGERHWVTMFETSTEILMKTSMNDGRVFNVTVNLYPVSYDEVPT